MRAAPPWLAKPAALSFIHDSMEGFLIEGKLHIHKGGKTSFLQHPSKQKKASNYKDAKRVQWKSYVMLYFLLYIVRRIASILESCFGSASAAVVLWLYMILDLPFRHTTRREFMTAPFISMHVPDHDHE